MEYFNFYGQEFWKHKLKSSRGKPVQWTFLKSGLLKRLLQQLQILDVKILFIFKGFYSF